MNKTIYLALLCLCLPVWITACSGQALASATGDPQAGEALFHQTAIREAPACATCHSTTPGELIVGPSLAGIGARAAERIPNLSAEAYLRESILEPNLYVVEGFSPGVMYQGFKDVLTEEAINDLIAYLLTLR